MNEDTLARLVLLTSPYDPLLLECDGLTHVLHDVLLKASVPHQTCFGQITHVNANRKVHTHFWIETEVHRIDYRARMWLPDLTDVPHGVWDKTLATTLDYAGQAVSLTTLSDELIELLIQEATPPPSGRGFRLNARVCDTCIFGPHSPIPPERLLELQDVWRKNDQAQLCHQTNNVGCRGHFEAGRRGEMPHPTFEHLKRLGIGDPKAAVQLMENLGLIQYVEHSVTQTSPNKRVGDDSGA